MWSKEQIAAQDEEYRAFRAMNRAPAPGSAAAVMKAICDEKIPTPPDRRLSDFAEAAPATPRQLLIVSAAIMQFYGA